ncbi:MAG TPA: hypothetical protein VFX37_00435 [Pseudolabrys sp.]|nr:hypothetical protein [Pseudolabrys sp.]
MNARILFVVCVATLMLAPVSAQQKPVRIRGTIEQMNGQTMTVKSREGDTLKVKLTDDAKVLAIVKASLSDIKPGSFVGSTAMPQPDGSWDAVEVHIFPESMRGSGEGDRPFDYKPKSTMTNGTVNTLSKAKMAGAVTKEEGTTMTLHYKDGDKKINITPETKIVTYAPGSKDELKPGAKIIIGRAMRQSDGTLTANRVNVGRGIAPPM